ncbi:MAG: hypothetical protein K1W16_10950 [Lachnospiraceae bacterium]|jgi:hypothetical protein
MNKERLTAWGFVIVFFIICIIPSAGMLFYHSELAENRTLSEKPKFRTEEGKWNQDFFEELQTYVSEHFAFRGELVEADSFIKYKLLRTPNDDQVVIGKEGWLFFGQTLADYVGVTLPDEEIDKIANTLLEVSQYVEHMGKKPLFVIVPNKNSIYPEYMPARFGSRAECRNLTLLQERMTDKKIPFVDAYHLLTAYKDTEEVYLHEDTHWNHTGARLVLNEIYAAFGISEQYTLTGYTIEKNHEPDLYKILFPSSEYFEAQHIYEDNQQYDYVGRLHSLDDIKIRTTSSAQNGSILVYRDSFGRAMIPFMGGSFSQAVFNRSTPYDLSIIENTECDYVLFEIVERNLQDLGQMVIPE